MCGSHYCETRMDDIRVAERQCRARGERSGGSNDDGNASCVIARARQLSSDPFRANFSRERKLLRARNQKGVRPEGRRGFVEDGCIILTTLRKLWQHSIILAPSIPAPLTAAVVGGDEPPVASLTA